MASFKELQDLKKQQAALRAAVSSGMIVKPDAAAERERADKVAKVQAHMDIADVERDAAVNLFHALLLAETRAAGTPNRAKIDMLKQLAGELTKERYSEKWLARAELFAELGISELSEDSSHWRWAAKQHGIDLVPVVEKPEPPKLVQG